MPQIKHNKKRNAGLLYEWLVGYVSEIVAFSDDEESADACIEMMCRYFDKVTDLGKELHAVRSLANRHYAAEDRVLAAQAIAEFKQSIGDVDFRQSNIEKSNLIKEINLTISNRLYDKDVKEYRLNASIYGLIEAIKRQDPAEQARFEALILSNLCDATIVAETMEEEQLSEEDRALVRTQKFLSSMGKRIQEKLGGMAMTKNQQSVMENWDGWQRGAIDDQTYRRFLDSQLAAITEFITKVEESPNAQSSEVTSRSVSGLKEIYTEEAVANFSDEDLTEHILEGLGIERFIDEA